MYTIKDVLGKGQGLVAAEKICKGTRLLCEEPLIRINGPINSEQIRTSIRQQVEALSQDHRRVFLSMHNIYPHGDIVEQYLGIVQTNSLPAEQIGDKGAIFLDACRINHACDNNAQKSWNARIERHTVHAIRDIDEGEEITITYLYPLKNREERQEALKRKFDFSCTCQLCSLSSRQSNESDKRLEEIRHLDDVVNGLGIESLLISPVRTLRYFDRQVCLYEKQEREDVGFAQALVYAAQLVITNGDLARGRIFAEKAASVWETTVGSDDVQTMKWRTLARDPTKYEQYGFSKLWMTKINDVPQGLESNDFDDWLWKREKPKLVGELANSRNRTTFACFNDLPDRDSDISDFSESSERDSNRQQRHWCFLGEIVRFHTLHHLEIDLMDVESETIPLHFYTDDRGSELVPAKIQKGHTVAVLNAKRHTFRYGKPGIRHEDPEMIKIFPLSLQKLLVLNDQFLQFSAELDGNRLCHGCGKKATTLQRCGKCLSFWYCDTACQVLGWNEKGHKADCKLLRDPDLRALLAFEWVKFTHGIRFPLHAATE